MSDLVAAAPNQSTVATAPFPGLRPFAKRDHKYFFGREDQTFALYRLLRTNHFIAVVGSSGSGKSSIVRAGLLPLLEQENGESGRKVWQYAAMRPGRAPIDRLAIGLAKVLGDRDEFFAARRDRIAALLFASSHGLSDALQYVAPDPETQLVVLVDQFEELFRYMSAGAQINTRFEMSQRREEAINFIQLLLAATRSHDSRIRVVITMRSDFIGDCARFQGLPEAVSSAQFLVPSLSRDQREEAIRGPIEMSGATISSELVERLINDSSEELDQLPILQHCLARLWMRAGTVAGEAADGCAGSEPPTRHLTEQDYRDIGGLSGAISGHAEEIFSSLPGREKIVEQVFRALAEIDSEGRAVRRARSLGQLIGESGASRDDVCAVLDQFRADECSFLVPPLSSSLTANLPDDTIVDVGHEALLRRWTRVSGDPEATGERGDKREIGWLRQELRDGERYRFLHSCVDPQSLNESRLSDDQARRYWGWWNKWHPNAAWSARYGGRYEEVERLVRASYAASGRSRNLRNVTYAGIGVALILLAVGSTALYRASETFKHVALSTRNLSSAVLDSFNAGQTSLQSATKYRDIVKDLYDRFDDLPNTAQVSQLKTSWLLTSSDLNVALDDKAAARRDASKAEETTRPYLEKSPDDKGWLRLRYGALFRLGDLDLEDSVVYDGTGTVVARNQEPIAAALANYQESERIAAKLLEFDVTNPTSINPESIDHLAQQRFELAFALNKTGEALQVKRDFAGATSKFKRALEYATMIQGASRMEWKLQAAATQIKIGRVQRDFADIDGALQSYSDAIGREELLFLAYSHDKILRSNLASSYEDRAALYRTKKSYDLALQEFAKAGQILTALNEEDPRNMRILDGLARIYAKAGAVEQDKAVLQDLPLDMVIVQFRKEVSVREKIAQRRAGDQAFQDRLLQSQDKLKRVELAAAGAAKEVSKSLETK
ncbi:nSTAND1 domain-containing NTPase [Bradyrhizobium sp. CCBAU 11386]|uniref:nSTAND1 domain-containing NTPase n=1 Tax=Bradyrhizobium sp. CCBAU 11386 TaxID=1630837 RepID=UPI0023045F01|nr:hypothetical protein [Bradyrhizobium sp. CCBAU 11386]